MDERSKTEPGFSDWWQLSRVAASVDAILEDAPVEVTERQIPSNGGLLGLLGRLVTVKSEAPPEGPRVSRFAAQSAHSLFDDDLRTQLPGLTELGDSPVERLANLRKLLRDRQPAYRWLHQQPSYGAALAVMERGRIEPDTYKHPWAEFRLLAAICPHLTTAWAFRDREPRFPSKRELENALESAQAVAAIYRANVALREGSSKDYNNTVAARNIVQELEQALAGFNAKPKDDRVAFNLQILQSLIRSTAEAFGKPSTTLLAHLAELAGYRVAITNIQKEISALGLSSPSKRQAPGVVRPAKPHKTGWWGGVVPGRAGED